MKIYLDLQKQAITKTTDENIYQGDIYSNAFEILFYNYTNSNWFPTMSQLAPNGRKAGEFSADALEVGESHEVTEDGVTYLKFTFTMGTSWVLMKGRSEFYIWFNRLGGAIVQKKCVGVVNVMIDQSTTDYFIADPTFNPNVKTYIDACIAELGDGSPKYFDTASNIANCTEDKGLAVATDTGHLYYWDETKNSTTKYTDSGLVYNDLSLYYTKTEVDGALALKADKSDTYTKTETDNLLALKADKSDTYTKTETDNLLDLKADKSTTYTKTETNALLDTKADKATTYTKTETDGKLALKADKFDTYTKTVINNFIADLETRKANKSNTYTKEEIDTTINGIGEMFGLIESAIGKLESVQNVVDVVATKSALNSYDTSKLEENDKIQVIADETHDGASTIYNWSGSAWQYVGAFGGNSYTKAETYNKTQIDSALSDKADKSNTYTKTEEDAKFEEVGQMFEIVGNEVLKKADKTELNNAINDLRWELGSHTLDVSSDTDVAFSKSVPANAIGCQINKIGGMSCKSENLLALQDVAQTTTNGITYKAENGIITLNGTASAEVSISFSVSLSLSGTYTLSAFNTFTITNSLFLITTEGNKSVYLNATNKSNSFTFTSATASQVIIYIPSGTVLSNATFSPMLVSGSTAPSEFKPYFSGIRDSAVTSVISKGANLIGLNDETTSYYKISNGEITSLDNNSHTIELKNPITLIANNTYSFNRFMGYAQLNVALLDENSNTVFNGTWGTITASITPESDTIVKYIKWNVTSSAIGTIFKPMLVKGSTAPTEYKPYVTPIIKPIPSEIQNLTGYGWGLSESASDYLYYLNKKYVQAVNREKLKDLNWDYDGTNFVSRGDITNSKYDSTFNGLCSKYVNGGTIYQRNDGNENGKVYMYYNRNYPEFSGYIYICDTNYTNATDFKNHFTDDDYIYYELATPIETDISQYLTDDTIDVEGGGSIEFTNTYSQAVPSDIDYLIEEMKA